MINRNDPVELLKFSSIKRVVMPEEWRLWAADFVTVKFVDILSAIRLESLVTMGEIQSENQDVFIAEYNRERGKYELINDIFNLLDKKMTPEEK